MTASNLLIIAVSFFAGLVLRNLGHTQGYRDGYAAHKKAFEDTMKAYMAWLEPQDRNHFRVKWAEFQTLQLVQIIEKLMSPKALEGDGSTNV